MVKFWGVVILGLVVGCFGNPFDRSEWKQLQRLIDTIEEKQVTGMGTGPPGASGVPTTSPPVQNSSHTSIESWIASNLLPELSGRSINNVTMEELIWELDYLTGLYIQERAGSLQNCVYLGTSMSLTKTLLKFNMGPVFLSEVGAILLSQSLKAPTIPVMKALKQDAKVIAPELIRIFLGPVDEFTNTLKNEISTKLGINITQIEEIVKSLEFRPPPRGTFPPPVETIEGRIAKVLRAIEKIINTLKARNVNEQVCDAEIPMILKNKLELVFNKTENVNITVLDNRTASLLNISVHQVYPVVVDLFYNLVYMGMDVLYQVYYDLEFTPYNHFTFINLLEKVLNFFIKKTTMRNVAEQVNNVLLSKFNSEFSMKIGQLDVNKLEAITKDMLVTLHMKLSPNDPCLSVRLLATIAGVVQMDRFKLLERNNDKIKTLKMRVVGILQKVEPGLNVEKVKTGVDVVVAKLFLKSAQNFIYMLEEMMGGKIPSEINPLEVMKIASNLCKNNTRDVIRTVVKSIARNEMKELWCYGDPYIQMDEGIRWFVQDLNTTDMYDVGNNVYEVLCERVNNKTCANESAMIDVVMEFMDLYPAALSPIVEELKTMASLMETTPPQAMDHMRDFAAKHMANVIFKAVREGPCGRTPGPIEKK